MSTRKLIVNADDFGYSRAVNYGILDAHLNGMLTSTTLMANMPGFDHAVEIAKANPKLGVGVHLVLSCDAPLLDTHKTIVTSNGNFFPSVRVIRAEHLDAIDLEEVYAEWKAQIEKVIASGITPTHLDSHQHSGALPRINDVFVKLAKEYDLPVRNLFDVEAAGVKSTTYFENDYDNLGYAEAGEFEMTAEEEKAYLDGVYQKILDNESTEIMCHPAYIDSKLLNNSSFQLQRLGEMYHLTESELVKKILANEKIELVTFADL